MSEYEQPVPDTEEANAAAWASYEARLADLKLKTPVAYLDGGEVFVEFCENRGHDIFIWNAELLQAIGFVSGDATTDDHVKALMAEHGTDCVEKYEHTRSE